MDRSAFPGPYPSAVTDRFKYRLALVVDEVCVVRFDNEIGKGDHKHIGEKQFPYFFTDLEQLVTDFWRRLRRFLPQSRDVPKQEPSWPGRCPGHP